MQILESISRLESTIAVITLIFLAASLLFRFVLYCVKNIRAAAKRIAGNAGVEGAKELPIDLDPATPHTL